MWVGGGAGVCTFFMRTHPHGSCMGVGGGAGVCTFFMRTHPHGSCTYGGRRGGWRLHLFCITFGSVSDSILESFWEPSSPLYSFLVAGVTDRGAPRGTLLAMRFCIPFFMDFRCQGDLQEGCRRLGRGPSGNQVILHLGPWRMILPCVFEDSVQRPPRSPKEKSLK